MLVKNMQQMMTFASASYRQLFAKKPFFNPATFVAHCAFASVPLPPTPLNKIKSQKKQRLEKQITHRKMRIETGQLIALDDHPSNFDLIPFRRKQRGSGRKAILANPWRQGTAGRNSTSNRPQHRRSSASTIDSSSPPTPVWGMRIPRT